MYCKASNEIVSIRPIELTDAAFILKLTNTPKWLQFIGNRNINNIIGAEAYIQNLLANNAVYYHVIDSTKNKESVGVLTLLKRDYLDYPDLGFALLPEHESKGYAIAACKLYLSFYQSKIQKGNLLGITIPNNLSSIRLLKKLGFNWKEDIKQNGNDLSVYQLQFD